MTEEVDVDESALKAQQVKNELLKLDEMKIMQVWALQVHMQL